MQWIQNDIVEEGQNWDIIINDPRVTSHWLAPKIDGKGPSSTPRHFANNVLKKEFTSDILKNCPIVGSERQLIIVCMIPDPEYLRPDTPLEESKAAGKKAIKKEPESKKAKGKPASPDFQAPYRPNTRGERASMDDEDSQFDKVADFFKGEYIKVEEEDEIKEEDSEGSEVRFIFIRSSHILTPLGVS